MIEMSVKRASQTQGDIKRGDKQETGDEDGNGCRHPFGSCYPAKTKAQDIQRTEQAVRPRWKRREGPALERGCTSTFLFLG